MLVVHGSALLGTWDGSGQYGPAYVEDGVIYRDPRRDTVHPYRDVRGSALELVTASGERCTARVTDVRIGLSIFTDEPLVPPAELTGENGNHELWALVLEAARLDEIVEQVIRSLEFSVLAKYAFSLAQGFNAFYHRSQILNEDREDVRRWRAAGVIYLRDQLTRALDLMGVAVPSRM